MPLDGEANVSFRQVLIKDLLTIVSTTVDICPLVPAGSLFSMSLKTESQSTKMFRFSRGEKKGNLWVKIKLKSSQSVKQSS